MYIHIYTYTHTHVNTNYTCVYIYIYIYIHTNILSFWDLKLREAIVRTRIASASLRRALL